MSISCLGDEGFLAREFSQWHTQTFTYEFLVSEPCRIPGFLKQMLKNGDLQLVEGKSFEYRMMQEYMFSDNSEEKNWGLSALQKIYEASKNL